MTFVLVGMNFVSIFRKKEDKYLCKEIINIANQLNQDRLKNIEHGIIAGIRVLLSLSIEGIREFLRDKVRKITGGNNLSLFDKILNPYEILGKL